MLHLQTLAEAYEETNPDSSYFYAEQQLSLARSLQLKLNEAYALNDMGYAQLNMGNYPKSLRFLLAALEIAEDPESERHVLPEKYLNPKDYLKRPVTAHMLRLEMLGTTHSNLAILYGNTASYEKELSHFLLARTLVEQAGNGFLLYSIDMGLGRIYLSRQQLDSALRCEQRAYQLCLQTGHKKYLGSILLTTAKIYAARGNPAQAKNYFRQALLASAEEKYFRGVVACNLALANLFRQGGQKDSNFYYANTAFQLARHLNIPDLLLRSYTELAAFYKSVNNSDSAVKYQGLIIGVKDSVFNARQTQQFNNIDAYEQQRKQELQEARKSFHNRLRLYGLSVGLLVFLLLSVVLWHNNRQRKKTNFLLEHQKSRIEKTLEQLQAAQAQLIQSEKMASLGELTAGIAHEIQNPLNFVNNFSETNKELIEEIQQAAQQGSLQEVIALANDLKANEEKIAHHGKRADSIVKGMLEHSKGTTGEKQSTDLNALVAQYLQLAYSGYRAKDKTFNADLNTQYDQAIGKLSLVPQEIGRVLLNLFNNAFYAVQQQKALRNGTFEPAVTVCTKQEEGKVIITVKDNGTGISQKSMGKIFQPFFTTKPTGEATGLGLSLSYDIVTKGHGGTLSVQSVEGAGSEFVVQLPTI